MLKENKKTMVMAFFIAFFYLSQSYSSDFTSHTVGLRAAAGLYNNQANSRANLPTTVLTTDINAAGNLFTFGMQYEVDFINPNSEFTQGISIGGDINLNKGKSYFRNDSHNNVNISDGFEFFSLKHKLDIAVRFGWLFDNKNHLFIKAGGVLGKWRFNGRYLNYLNNSTKNVGGVLMGVGLDMPVSKNIFIGSTIEYEHYLTMKGNYTHPSVANSFTQWSAKPSIARATFNIKYRFAEDSTHLRKKENSIEQKRRPPQRQIYSSESKGYCIYKKHNHKSSDVF